MTFASPLKRGHSQHFPPSLLTYSGSPEHAYDVPADASDDDDVSDDGEEHDEESERDSGLDAPRRVSQRKRSESSPSACSQRARKSWSSVGSRFSISSTLQDAKEAFATTRKSLHLGDSMAASFHQLRNGNTFRRAEPSQCSSAPSPVDNDQQKQKQKQPRRLRPRAVSYQSKLTKYLPDVMTSRKRTTGNARRGEKRDSPTEKPSNWTKDAGDNQTAHESCCAYPISLDESNQKES